MQRLMTINVLKKAYCAGLAIGIISCLSGCQEANMAIDFIVGRQSPVMSPTPQFERPPIILAARRTAGESPAPVPTAAAGPTAPEMTLRSHRPARSGNCSSSRSCPTAGETSRPGRFSSWRRL